MKELKKKRKKNGEEKYEMPDHIDFEDDMWEEYEKSVGTYKPYEKPMFSKD